MERIFQKIERIKEYLRLLQTLRPECHDRFPLDPIFRGAVLHYLYLLSDGCIVLAELVIRQRRLRLPQTYAESFDILAREGPFRRILPMLLPPLPDSGIFWPMTTKGWMT